MATSERLALPPQKGATKTVASSCTPDQFTIHCILSLRLSKVCGNMMDFAMLQDVGECMENPPFDASEESRVDFLIERQAL